MQVQKLMCKDVQAASVHDSLADAARIMWDCDCGAVPVIDDRQRVVGMITDRDICMAAYISGHTLSELPIHGTMARELSTCRPEDDVASAESVMRRGQLHRLPVTDGGGRLVGMLSLTDIAHEAEREQNERSPEVTLKEVGLTLSAVSRPRSQSASARA